MFLLKNGVRFDFINGRILADYTRASSGRPKARETLADPWWDIFNNKCRPFSPTTYHIPRQNTPSDYYGKKKKNQITHKLSEKAQERGGNDGVPLAQWQLYLPEAIFRTCAAFMRDALAQIFSVLHINMLLWRISSLPLSDSRQVPQLDKLPRLWRISKTG